MNDADLLSTLSIKVKRKEKNISEVINKKGISGHILEKRSSSSRGWQVTVTEDQRVRKVYKIIGAQHKPHVVNLRALT